MTEPTVQVPDHGITAEQFPAEAKITQEHIDGAVETVRRLAGWHIWPEREETLKVDAPGDPMVFLPTKMLTEVHSLTIDGKTIDVGELDWSQDGMVWVGGLRPNRTGRPRRVVAKVRHGYAGPGDLLALVKTMAGRGGAPNQSLQVGRISVGAPGAMTPQSTEWRIIDQFKLGPMP